MGHKETANSNEVRIGTCGRHRRTALGTPVPLGTGVRNGSLWLPCATTSPLKNADFEAFGRFNGGHIWTLGRGARVGLSYMGVENRLFTTLLSQKTMRFNSFLFE